MVLSKEAKVTSKGQVTIPAEVREALAIAEGDSVTFEVSEAGEAVLRATKGGSPFAQYAGALKENKDVGAQYIVDELRKERGW